MTARVQPEIVQAGDLLASIDGAANAVVCQASPIGEVTIIGPGTGLQLAGQGCSATSSRSQDGRQRTPAFLEAVERSSRTSQQSRTKIR